MKMKASQFRLLVLLALFMGALFMIMAPGVDAGLNPFVSADDGEWVGAGVYHLQGRVSPAPESFKFYAVRVSPPHEYVVGDTEVVELNCPTAICQWEADLDLSGLAPGTYFLRVEVRLPGNIFKQDTFPKGDDSEPECDRDTCLGG